MYSEAGFHAIKLFFLSLTLWLNKLDRLSLGNFYQLVSLDAKKELTEVEWPTLPISLCSYSQIWDSFARENFSFLIYFCYYVSHFIRHLCDVTFLNPSLLTSGIPTGVWHLCSLKIDKDMQENP